MITHDDVSLLFAPLRRHSLLLPKRASRVSSFPYACSYTQRSLSFCFWIYIKWNWKNAIEFFSNSYSSRNARRILSLPKTNETLFGCCCWRRRRRRLGGVRFVVFVVFGRFFFDTYKMRTTSTTNRNVVLVLKGVTDDDARRPQHQFWRRRRTKRRRPSSSFPPRNVTTRNNDGRGGRGRDETHYLDYPTVIKAFVLKAFVSSQKSLSFLSSMLKIHA